MKISVLIPAHRSALELPHALAGVGAQVHDDWELVLAEYGRPDDTRALVHQFAGACRRPVHYLHLGEAAEPAVWNRLLELATGAAVAFLEPSDAWAPRHLAAAATLLAGTADLVAADVDVTPGPSGGSHAGLAVSPHLAANPLRALYARDALAIASAVVFRRELVARVGYFDTRLRALAPRDFWLRCALQDARFAATHCCTCRAPRRPAPDLSRALVLAELTVQFYEKHRDVAAVPAALRRRLLSASLVTQGRLLRASDPTRAARCFWRAWSLQPMHVQTLGQFALTNWRSAEPGRPPAAGDAPPP